MMHRVTRPQATVQGVTRGTMVRSVTHPVVTVKLGRVILKQEVVQVDVQPAMRVAGVIRVITLYDE